MKYVRTMLSLCHRGTYKLYLKKVSESTSNESYSFYTSRLVQCRNIGCNKHKTSQITSAPNNLIITF